MTQENSSTPESQDPTVFLDDLEQLLFDEVERAAGDWSAVETALCGRHPELAGAIARRMRILRDAGFLQEPTPEPAQPPTQSLTPGQTLSSYEVIELLGKGGMGEVYRAHDTKLGRDVAIKVLPSEFARDEERVRRFQREAKLVASLNHSHIATIHSFEGVEHASGDDQTTTRFLVLEYVEGETLAKRIEKGPLPVAEATRVAVQIASALEAAHDKGVVHRDLKPANVQIKPDGTVKILDFGLARVVADGPSAARQAVTAITEEHRHAGVVFGTAPYMSPEQVRGTAVDKRTDIWAFGCVLYELVTARRAFSGLSVTETLAKVLESEPDWDRDPPVPARLRPVLRRCLMKDAAERFGSIGDVRRKLEAAERPPQESRSRAAMTSARRRGLVAAVVALLAVAISVFAPTLFGAAAKSRLAVLPFEPHRAEDGDLADLVTLDVYSQLAGIPELLVRDRLSTQRYRDTADLTAALIGAKLDVDCLLLGRVRQEGDRVVVTPELFVVADNAAMSLGQQELHLATLDKLPQAVSDAVASALGVQFSGPARRSRASRDFDAALKYVAAVKAHDRGWQIDDLAKAERLYGEAIAHDARYALAHAGRSRVHSLMFWHHDHSQNRIDKAWEDAENALKIDPDLAHGHLARGLFYFRVKCAYDEALAEFAKAERGLPNDSGLMWAKAFAMRRKGDYPGALEVMQKAYDRNPDASDSAGLAETLCWMRRYDEADTIIDQVISRVSTSVYPYTVKSAIWMCRGEPARAMKALEQGLTRDPGGQNLYDFLAWQAVLARDYERAIGYIEKLDGPLDVFGSYANPYEPRSLQLGRIRWLQGEDQKAKTLFEKTKRDVLKAIQELGSVETGWDHRLASQFQRSLGIAYAHLGDREKAMQAAAEAKALLPYSTDSNIGAFTVEYAAEIYTILGEDEKAMREIEFLLSKPYYYSPEYLRTDPRYESLLAHDRFKKMIGK